MRYEPEIKYGCPVRGLKRAVATLLMGFATGASAGMITTDPGDSAPLPEGTDLGVLYYQHAERNTLKVNHHDVPGDFRLNSDIALARYVKWTSLGGFLVTPQVILPYGHLKMSGDSQASESNFGDPIIGSNIWLLNDAVNERYFSLGGYISLPLGSYDDEKGSMNIGENRWKGAFEVNYVQAIIPHTLYGEITLEHDEFGKNDDFFGRTLRQDSVFEVQTHLRYVFGPTDQFGVSFFHTTGGENHLDGVGLDDSLNTKRYLLTWAHFLIPKTQLQAQTGRDLDVRNGPQENLRVNLRLAHIF
jgi:hypothetical protein